MIDKEIHKFYDNNTDILSGEMNLTLSDIDDMLGSIFMYSRIMMGKELMEFSYRGIGTFSYRHTEMFENLLKGKDCKYIPDNTKEYILKEDKRRKGRKSFLSYEDAKKKFGDDFNIGKYLSHKNIENRKYKVKKYYIKKVLNNENK